MTEGFYLYTRSNDFGRVLAEFGDRYFDPKLQNPLDPSTLDPSTLFEYNLSQAAAAWNRLSHWEVRREEGGVAKRKAVEFVFSGTTPNLGTGARQRHQGDTGPVCLECQGQKLTKHRRQTIKHRNTQTQTNDTHSCQHVAFVWSLFLSAFNNNHINLINTQRTTCVLFFLCCVGFVLTSNSNRNRNSNNNNNHRNNNNNNNTNNLQEWMKPTTSCLLPGTACLQPVTGCYYGFQIYTPPPRWDLDIDI